MGDKKRLVTFVDDFGEGRVEKERHVVVDDLEDRNVTARGRRVRLRDRGGGYPATRQRVAAEMRVGRRREVRQCRGRNRREIFGGARARRAPAQRLGGTMRCLLSSIATACAVSSLPLVGVSSFMRLNPHTRQSSPSVGTGPCAAQLSPPRRNRNRWFVLARQHFRPAWRRQTKAAREGRLSTENEIASTL